MRILYYIHDLNVGGAEKIVTDYLIKMQEDNIDVALLVNYKVRSFLADIITHHNIPTYSLFGMRTPNKVVNVIKKLAIKHLSLLGCRWNKVIKEFRPDIIHFHTTPLYYTSKIFPESRIVYTFHSEIKRHLKISSFIKTRLQTMADQGMHFITINKVMADECRNIFNSKNVLYIPNGIDFKPFTRVDKHKVLKEMNVPEDAYILGHVGRFHPVKNHEFIIKVFKEIVTKRNNAYLFLVGGGDSELIDRIKDIVSNEGLSGRVMFWGERHDVSRIMSSFDSLVLPSISESFSLVLIEAQYLGIRCVTSAAIHDEVICNDNCVKLSLADNPQRWAHELLSGSQDDNRSHKLMQYSIESVISKHIELYDSIINS